MRKGTKRKGTPAELARQRKNASNPHPGHKRTTRPHRSAAEALRIKIREALKVGVLSVLQADGVERMLEIMYTGKHGDSIRAWEALANRFGLAPEQRNVIMTQIGAPLVVFERVGFSKPGEEPAAEATH